MLVGQSKYGVDVPSKEVVVAPPLCIGNSTFSHVSPATIFNFAPRQCNDAVVGPTKLKIISL